MYTDFTNLSPEDKINKYNEINGTDNSTGYTNFVPNARVNPPSIDLPKVNISSLAPTGASVTPLLTGIKSTSPSKANDKEPAKISIDSSTNMEYPFTKQSQPLPSYKVNPNEAARQAYSYYVKQKGLPQHVAAAIVGNLYQESGLDPTRKQNGGGPGRGVAQWTVDGRWTGFQKWAQENNRNPDDLHSQLDYILVEPGQEHTLHKVLSSPDVDTATMAFGRGFEAPKESAANWQRRMSVARFLLNYTQ